MRWFRFLERGVEAWIQRFGVAVLQVSLGSVYLWFGALKLAGVNPLIPIAKVGFPAATLHTLANVLGVWEVLIGAGLLLPLLALPRWANGIVVRITLVLVLVQVAAVLAIALLHPTRLFDPAFPHVSVLGEVLVRYFVFAVAALVVAGHLREPDASPISPAR